MKAFYSNEEDCIDDLRRKFVLANPLMQSRVKFSCNEAAGSIVLGFHRGRQSGVYDSYRTLQKKFPKAATALLSAYSMDDEGTVTMLKKR